ncbi:MAG: hypothetical protein E6772_01440 [Dysgonomonas sp.]|nr:hypothetical protein [Dysgonomonas sp.]
MTLRDQIQRLAKNKSNPCVTISLNTHRTHPDSLKDQIVLKNLLNEAAKRILEEHNKRDVTPLLEKMKRVGEEFDRDNNLDSLHVFLSNDTEEIIKISWHISEDRISIDDTFDLRYLMKAYNRSEEYLILVLSQGGVILYEAINDGIEKEIKNEDFPFGETPYYVPDAEKKSDPKYVDNMVREFFNEVDKALVKFAQQTELKCVVISTEDNYRLLMEVANKPDIYLCHAAIDYNNTQPHNIARQGWEIVRKLLFEKRAEAIEEMKEAISDAKVLTDVKEIYQAAVDGRGDMLIVYEDYSQPAKLIDDRTIELVNDSTASGVVDDIVSMIAWEVISKKGRVFFTKQDSIKDLGEIVMKVRY